MIALPPVQKFSGGQFSSAYVTFVIAANAANGATPVALVITGDS
jgi:hypothetical protein